MITQEEKQLCFTLCAWHINGSVRRYLLEAGQGVFIGTSNNCGLRLIGHDLSDIHCRVDLEDDGLWIQDWMSTQGTRVNGELIESKSKLSLEDVIEIGVYKIEVSDRRDVVSLEAEPSAAAIESSVENSKSSADRPAVFENHARLASIEKEATGTLPALPLSSKSDDDKQYSEQTSQAEEQPNQSDERPNLGESVDEPEPVFAADFFAGECEEEPSYDRETVALLQAEIEDLQAMLAQRDADRIDVERENLTPDVATESNDKMLERMQELIEEANRSDERVAMLEEMLHAAEDANRSEYEERGHLEAWVGDIEKRIGQREHEHVVELDALRQRLNRANEEQTRLQHQLKQVATGGSAAHQYEDTLENLQQLNRQMQEQLADSQREYRLLQQKFEQQSEERESGLREERAKIAREHAEMSRLKYEFASKIKDLDEIPNAESDPRIDTLRQHRQYLREIHEKKKLEEKEAPITGRLKRLWKRVEH